MQRLVSRDETTFSQKHPRRGCVREDMASNRFQCSASNECHCCTRVSCNKSDPALIPTSNSLLTLYLVRKEYRDLRFARIRITTYKSSRMEHTLNSSESLDSLESICESIRALTTAISPAGRYLGELSGCQGIAGH